MFNAISLMQIKIFSTCFASSQPLIYDLLYELRPFTTMRCCQIYQEAIFTNLGLNRNLSGNVRKNIKNNYFNWPVLFNHGSFT